MKQLLLYGFSILSVTAHAQTVFFSSPKKFSEEELKVFYASINLEGDLLLFNATDYTLYAFDKASGDEKWNYYMKWKSNQAPFIVGEKIWARFDNDFVQLNAATGKETKTLGFGTVETQPFVKEGIFYFTAISGGAGCIMAYEPRQDTVLWSRFLAHGCQQKPYYLANKNAEGTRWIDMDYNGRLKDAVCDTVEYGFPSELPCAQQFFGLSHDGLPIAGKLATTLELDDNIAPDIFTIPTHSFILNKNKVTVLGNKLKQKAMLDLAFLELPEEYTAAYAKILTADASHVKVVYNNRLVIYNYQKKHIEKTIDLSAWEPHQVIADNNNLWIISKKDGRLYGITI